MIQNVIQNVSHVQTQTRSGIEEFVSHEGIKRGIKSVYIGIPRKGRVIQNVIQNVSRKHVRDTKCITRKEIRRNNGRKKESCVSFKDDAKLKR